MRQFLVISWFILATFLSYGQSLPPVQNFSISDYGAGSQNWAIAQSSDKHVFFGNNQGLLEYNGSAWKLYPTNNGTIIRSVKVIGDRVYSGFYMDFGYWERDEFGSLSYNSLLGDLDVPLIDDEHFWNIETRDEWILFQSLDRIYLYNTLESRFEVIDFPASRAKLFNLSDGIFVQSPEKGLFEVRNGSVSLASDNEIFKDDVVVGLYERGDGRLVVTEAGRFFRWEGESLSLLEIESLNRFEDLSLYSSLELRDGSFILGTVSNGFIHLDGEGNIIQSMNQESGLNNNTVLSIFEDLDNNLWLGLDNGISAVNLNSAFEVFTDSKGELGAVYSSIVVDGWFYVGTNQGLFCKKPDGPGEFQLIKGTNGQVWSLQHLKGTLFCGHNKGTFAIEGDKANLISDFSGTWAVMPIDGRDKLLIQGNYNGISVLENRNGVWVFRNRIRGFDISSRSMIFTGENEITVNHEFKGLFQLVIDSDFKEVQQSFTIPRIGYDSNISKYGEQNLFSSSEGVHFVDSSTRKLVPSEFLSEVFYNSEDRIKGKLIVEPTEGKLWGFSELNIICLEQDSFDGKPRVKKVPIPKFFRQNQGLQGFENIYPLGNLRYVIGTSDGYVLLDMAEKFQREYLVELTEVRKNVLNGETTPVPLADSSEFKYEENNVSFSFSVPEYDKYTEVDYQHRLIGLSEEWSPWSSKWEIEFGNLPFGDYTFVVRGRVGNEISANTASYSFTIARPWYLSTIALITYVVLALLLMGAIHRGYIRYYRKQREKLIEENEKNLALARMASEQEIIKLKNEQLQQDIESKNRELAMTTMSLVNKSELLNGIKKDLSNLQDKSSRDQVIRVINRNLNNDQDWEYFEEAFNNADKDFLKKVHELHPSLTPNDLKLCAYLRLNLSSKEIAPLLNISVRSVEIKRYRLRKKMNLEHEKGLVEYILEI